MFISGDILKLLSKSDDGWWTAEKDGVVGHFPSMLVEELSEDRDSGAFAGIIDNVLFDNKILKNKFCFQNQLVMNLKSLFHRRPPH